MKHPLEWEEAMTQVTLLLDPSVALFYSRIAESNGLLLEQVLCDALFKLAGELSLEAIRNQGLIFDNEN